jgi:hypothetical protein
MNMKKIWISAALLSGVSMLMALSACSGADREEKTDDLDEYCASVDNADEICEPDSDRASGDKGFNPF